MAPPVCTRCGRPHYQNQPCPANRPRPAAPRPARPPPVARPPAPAPPLLSPLERRGHYGGLCGYTPNQGSHKGKPCTRPHHPWSPWQHDYTPIPPRPRYCGFCDAAPCRCRPPGLEPAPVDRAPSDPTAADRNAQAIRQAAARVPVAPAPRPQAVEPDPAPAPGSIDDASQRFRLLELD